MMQRRAAMIWRTGRKTVYLVLLAMAALCAQADGRGASCSAPVRQTSPATERPLEGTAATELKLDIRGSPEGTPARDYIAAVHEAATAVWDDSSERPWTQNLAQAARQATRASAQGADILVLAEYGISGIPRELADPAVMLARFAQRLPSLDSTVTPCGDDSQSEVLAALSCMAQRNRLYIVANMVEEAPCDGPEPDTCSVERRSRYYNVNVVLDRDGVFIQKYRKANLFGLERSLLEKPEPRLAAFRTDFGVTFGLMTCFDILFEVPAVQLVRRGVTHFVFPTLWGDELPSLTALQMHPAWARGLGVTLLSAGFHLPHRRGFPSIGSGIFSGGGVLNYTYDYTAREGRLVTARVPREQPEPDHLDFSESSILGKPSGDEEMENTFSQATKTADEYYPVKNYQIDDYSSVLLSGRTQRLCHDDLCCEVSITKPAEKELVSQLSPPVTESSPGFRLLAYKGRRHQSPRWFTEVCSVVLCANSDHQSCNVFAGTSEVQLPPFRLSGSFANGTVVFPSVVLRHMRLGSGWGYDRSTRHLAVSDTNRLTAAQLYGRNFALDLP